MAPARRLLLVHAHPDDESIGTGATMARYAAEGAQVTLVTCTLGELGEIIPPSLAHLAAETEDRLGEYRIGELDAACAELGVTDHRFLGGPGRWRDSGMMGTEGNDDPRCFWRADVDQAGGRAARRHPRGPAAGAGDLRRQRLLRASRSHPGAPGRLARLRAGRTDTGWPSSTPPPRPDSGEVTTEIDATAYLGRKLAAMRAHATQITVDAPFFALSNQVRHEALRRGVLHAAGRPARPGAAPAGRETDLFAQ